MRWAARTTPLFYWNPSFFCNTCGSHCNNFKNNVWKVLLQKCNHMFSLDHCKLKNGTHIYLMKQMIISWFQMITWLFLVPTLTIFLLASPLETPFVVVLLILIGNVSDLKQRSGQLERLTQSNVNFVKKFWFFHTGLAALKLWASFFIFWW